MRVHQIVCTFCKASLKSQAGVPVGQQLTCPKCKKKFAVQEPAEEAEIFDDFELVDDDPKPPTKKGPPPTPAKKPAAKKPPVDDDDEDDALRKPKSKKPSRDDDDDEDAPRKPKAKKARRDDDEDDDRPRKKKKKKGRDEDENLFLRLKHNIAVRIITLVILFAILGVLGYLLYQKKMDERAANAETSMVPTLSITA